MSRTLGVVIIVFFLVCQPQNIPGQSLIEEAVTGLLGRTAKISRNIVDLARGKEEEPHQSGSILQGVLQPQGRPSGSIFFKPEDGTVVGGLFRGLMKDVDKNGKANTQMLLHPDQHQVVGGLLGGFLNGGATQNHPGNFADETPGIIEGLMRRRQDMSPERSPPYSENYDTRRQQYSQSGRSSSYREEKYVRRELPPVPKEEYVPGVIEGIMKRRQESSTRKQEVVSRRRSEEDMLQHRQELVARGSGGGGGGDGAGDGGGGVYDLNTTPEVEMKNGKMKDGILIQVETPVEVIDNLPVIRTSPGVVESLAKKGSDSIRSAASSVGEITNKKLAQVAPNLDEKLPPAVVDELEALRRDVARDAPECSQKAKAQLSKLLNNFRKGVLDCVGVEDADLADVLTRLRQVLLTADRLPTSLVHNLGRCSALNSLRRARQNGTQESIHIARIPNKRSKTDSSEVSAARCIIQALADARDRLQKIPSETAAFSRRVAFLLAGTKSDPRVRACVASQLTSMAHPIVATARELAGCVMVGPNFSTD